jgi:hypothetical protein
MTKFQILMKKLSLKLFNWSPDLNYRVGLSTNPFYLEFTKSTFYLCYKSNQILEIKVKECLNQTDPPIHVLISKIETAAKDYFGLQLSLDLGDLQFFEKHLTSHVELING